MYAASTCTSRPDEKSSRIRHALEGGSSENHSFSTILTRSKTTSLTRSRIANQVSLSRMTLESVLVRLEKSKHSNRVDRLHRVLRMFARSRDQ